MVKFINVSWYGLNKFLVFDGENVYGWEVMISEPVEHWMRNSDYTWKVDKQDKFIYIVAYKDGKEAARDFVNQEYYV